MKIHIFIEGEDEKVIIDRSYVVLDRQSPEIDTQELVDTAYKYIDDMGEFNPSKVDLSPSDEVFGGNN